MPKRLKKKAAPPAPVRATAPATFEAQLSAHMAKLGAKGGAISGAKRMEMPAKQRRDIAMRAAAARWRDRRPQ